MDRDFRFRKPERLCSKKLIQQLFSPQGRSLAAFPLRVVWMPVDPGCDAQVQMMVSVSKRKLRHAVDRNRAKRLVREAYRLNKHILLDKLGDRCLAVAFLWLPSDTRSFGEVGAKMRNLLVRVAEQVAELPQKSSAESSASPAEALVSPAELPVSPAE